MPILSHGPNSFMRPIGPYDFVVNSIVILISIFLNYCRYFFLFHIYHAVIAFQLHIDSLN